MSTAVFEGVFEPDGILLRTLRLTEQDRRTTMKILAQHQSQAHGVVHMNSPVEAGLRGALDLQEDVIVSLT